MKSTIHIVQSRNRKGWTDKFEDTYICYSPSDAIRKAMGYCKKFKVAKMDVRILEVTYREIDLPPFTTKK